MNGVGERKRNMQLLSEPLRKKCKTGVTERRSRNIKTARVDICNDISDAAKLMESSRCVRGNGRRWRCSQQSLIGHTRCEHHYRQLRQKGIKAARSRQEKITAGEFIKVDVKRKGYDAEKVMENSLCVCAKRGWKCSRPALAGHTVCEHHYGLLKPNNMESPECRQEEPDESTSDISVALVKVNAERKGNDGEKLMQDSRCVRSNGKEWRCSQPTCFGHTLCEHHYAAQLTYTNFKRARKRQQQNANSLSYSEDGNKRNSTVGTEKNRVMMMTEKRQKNINGRWLYFRAFIADDVHENNGVNVKEIVAGKLMDSHFICEQLHDIVFEDGEKTKGNQTAKIMDDSWPLCSDGRGCSQQAIRRAKEKKENNVDSSSYYKGNGEKGLLVMKRTGMGIKGKRPKSSDTKQFDVYVLDSGGAYGQVHNVKREEGEAEKQVDGYSMGERNFRQGREESVHKDLVDMCHCNNVFEKDRANARVSSEAEIMREDSWCKQWSCRQQALMGYNLCEHRLVQAGNCEVQLVAVEREGVNVNAKTSMTTDKRLVDDFGGMVHGGSVNRKGREAADRTEDSRSRCTDRIVKRNTTTAANSVDCQFSCLEGHDVVLKDDEKKDGSQTAKITEDLRCKRSNGKEWRCSRQALLGYNWCEHHFRLISSRRAKESKEKNVDSISNYEGQSEKGLLVGVKGEEIDVRGERSKSCETKWLDVYANPDTERKGHEAEKQEKRESHFGKEMERSDHKKPFNMNHCSAVLEKDRASMENRVTDRIAEDSQCIRTNGKRWRCRHQALVGYKLCKHHLAQAANYKHKNVDTRSGKKEEDGNSQLVAMKSKGLNLNEKSSGMIDQKMVDRCGDFQVVFQEGSVERKRSATAYISEDSRCRCIDGNGWRCGEQAPAGYNFCEHHLGK